MNQSTVHETPRRSARGYRFVFAPVGVLPLLYLAGYLPRHRTEAVVEAEARSTRIHVPSVNAQHPDPAPATSQLTLPGNITPLLEAYIYGRTPGYLKRRQVDIGDRVTAGQLLAEIDAPDLDQQVTQAHAAVSQAEAQIEQAQASVQRLKAQLELASVTWDRYRVLVAKGALSRQDGDTQEEAFQAAQASLLAGQRNVTAQRDQLQAAQANLERLRALKAYERVTAPFAGIITSRNVDVGALISAGGQSLGPVAATSRAADGAVGGEMFRVAQISTLRVTIPVPQTDASRVQIGQPATVVAPEFPDRKFAGRITRTSNALDEASRTLLTEVQIANPRGILLPGMFVEVRLTVTRMRPPLLVRGSSLVVRSDGPQLAVLTPLTEQERQNALNAGRAAADLRDAHRVHFQKVRLGHDLGESLEILDGVDAQTIIATNISDEVQEGTLVKPVLEGGVRR